MSGFSLIDKRHFCRHCLFLMIVAVFTMGSWCSGITSTSHAEGPGFKSQWVHKFLLASKVGQLNKNVAKLSICVFVSLPLRFAKSASSGNTVFRMGGHLLGQRLVWPTACLANGAFSNGVVWPTARSANGSLGKQPVWQ